MVPRIVADGEVMVRKGEWMPDTREIKSKVPW